MLLLPSQFIMVMVKATFHTFTLLEGEFMTQLLAMMLACASSWHLSAPIYSCRHVARAAMPLKWTCCLQHALTMDLADSGDAGQAPAKYAISIALNAAIMLGLYFFGEWMYRQHTHCITWRLCIPQVADCQAATLCNMQHLLTLGLGMSLLLQGTSVAPVRGSTGSSSTASHVP